jgi:hypothetical protein
MTKYVIQINPLMDLEEIEAENLIEAQEYAESRMGYTQENVKIYDVNHDLLCISEWNSMSIEDAMDTIEDVDSGNTEDVEWFKDEFVLVGIGDGFYMKWEEDNI